MFVFPAPPPCSLSVCVCEYGVTECLNYGLIVSLAGFCCWHHIGPVKVNYWNMFICCQPLPQAVTCMETQDKHTQKPFTQTIHRAPRVLQALKRFPQLLLFLLHHTLYTTQVSQPVMQTLDDPAVSLHPKGIQVTRIYMGSADQDPASLS